MPFWFNPRLRRLCWVVTLVAVPCAANGAELLPWRLPPIAMSTPKRLPAVPPPAVPQPVALPAEDPPVAISFAVRLPVVPPPVVPPRAVSLHAVAPTDSPAADRAVSPSSVPPVAVSPALERDLAPSIDPLGMLRSGIVTDWNDIGSVLPAAAEQAAVLVRRASTRASRGALYSAKHDLEDSLIILSQALDTFHETTEFTRCLREGLWAVEEASDFSPMQGTQRMTVNVSNTILKHRSKIITSDEAAHLSALEAERKYYAFAQEQLAASMGGSPVGAHAIYGLGKLYMGMSQLDGKGERLYAPRAMTMHQTALLIDHLHGLAANELGFLLARSGRLRDACDVLRHSASSNGPPDAWRNLADVYDRLGDADLAQHARAQWQRSAQLANAQSTPVVTAPNGLTIRWVDKATFERGTSGGTVQPMPPAPTQVPEATPPTRFAGSPSRFAW